MGICCSEGDAGLIAANAPKKGIAVKQEIKVKSPKHSSKSSSKNHSRKSSLNSVLEHSVHLSPKNHDENPMQNALAAAML